MSNVKVQKAISDNTKRAKQKPERGADEIPKIRELIREVARKKDNSEELIEHIRHFDERLAAYQKRNLQAMEELKDCVNASKQVYSEKMEELFVLKKELISMLDSYGRFRQQSTAGRSVQSSIQALERSGSARPINGAASQGLKGR